MKINILTKEDDVKYYILQILFPNGQTATCEDTRYYTEQEAEDKAVRILDFIKKQQKDG